MLNTDESEQKLDVVKVLFHFDALFSSCQYHTKYNKIDAVRMYIVAVEDQINHNIPPDEILSAHFDAFLKNMKFIAPEIRKLLTEET